MEKSQGRGNAKWVLRLILPLASLLLVCPFQEAEAVQHQVGGTSVQWTLPSRANVNYTTWASAQTFSVGDTLYFSYNSTYHNVLQVTEANYDTCDTSSPIAKWDDGATTVPLNKTGTFYFICGITGHCAAGQKVAVFVGASSSMSATALSPLSSLFAALFLISILLFPI